MRIEFPKDEYWYGGPVKNGSKMPLSHDSNIVIDTRVNRTPNQAMPLFISTKGRYIWKKEGFMISFSEGVIEIDDDCFISECYGDLRRGYLKAMEKEFPFRGGTPAPELFKNPIYNTWIELTFDQNQKDILSYADGILENGMPPGVLMIDDGWSEYYGNWSFHTGRFPDPKAMIASLHSRGFKVMLWLCPFISADTVKYREALAKGILIRDEKGEPYIVHWWNGFSAVLDMSNPKAVSWLSSQLDALTDMGVDGFKFDAGDSFFYEAPNQTFANTSPNEQSILWERFGEKYPYNEYRVTYLAGGAPVLQRLCDKQHSWNTEGIGGLMPDSLLQGLTGHPFSCPDMIGGGEYVNFHEALGSRFDEELFVRHCEIACLMPAMQFSAAPYRLLSSKNYDKILSCIRLRESMNDYIMELVTAAGSTGEPIIRYMAYEFPGEGCDTVIDQFMLGDRYLVAPIYEKGARGRNVFLPKGDWIRNGQVITGTGDYRWLDEGEEPLILLRLKTWTDKS
ncbi:glycoside hydrolase family 31 protein [Butyrivibrio sp. MC2013]|uniref:glycoside hydrolase family 31 protein n=1 Tax=Butyrivibrio sp. MC2013 TaxID=1280686 RepID=UPI00040AD677|nr:glycoside hydrolase family 31 protein [Butyrivibrio sp. MC2013]